MERYGCLPGAEEAENAERLAFGAGPAEEVSGEPLAAGQPAAEAHGKRRLLAPRESAGEEVSREIIGMGDAEPTHCSDNR